MGISAAGARRAVLLLNRFHYARQSFPVAISPLRLALGPSAFHHVVRHMVAHTDGYTNLLDDLIIWGATVVEQDRRLRQVLTRLQQAVWCHGTRGQVHSRREGSRLQRTSSVIRRHLTIRRIPVPTNRRQLLRFLATASDYLKFVSGFAGLCESLRRLMKAHAERVWSADCQRAFQLVKDQIASKPVLAHFDVTASTIVTSLTCDSSATALGACLSQRKNDIEHPVAFASRVLTQRSANILRQNEKRWHVFGPANGGICSCTAVDSR
jgi:hypothetical protein